MSGSRSCIRLSRNRTRLWRTLGSTWQISRNRRYGQMMAISGPILMLYAQSYCRTLLKRVEEGSGSKYTRVVDLPED